MRKSDQITPIFILGSARNGTTSLANLVARQAEIAGIAHWLHHGQLESNLCSWNIQYQKGPTPTYPQGFMAAYFESDYFRLSDQAKITYQDRNYSNFYECYFDLMDAYAKRRECKSWVTKFDPLFVIYPEELTLFLNSLKDRYKKVIVLDIQRELKAVIRSYLNMEGERSDIRKAAWLSPFFASLETIRYSATYYALRKSIRQQVKDYQLIPFSDLISNSSVLYATIADQLDIPVINNDKQSKTFTVNSSFQTDQQKTATKSLLYPFIGLIHRLLKLQPGIAVILYRLYFTIWGRFPKLYRRLDLFENDPDALIQDCKKRRALGLLKIIEQRMQTNTPKDK